MSREVINVGAAPNDGQGDPIRTSFIKCNNNFGELYARAQENPPATLVGTVGDVAGMYAYSANYFYYCYQDYDGSSTIWAEIPNTVIDAIEIQNGGSSVRIPAANSNVNVSVAGVANVAVFTSTGTLINGDLTVTGNANLSGNIIGDRITNGSTSIEIPAANGNATVSVAGTPNVAVFSNTALSVTGSVQTGNIVVDAGGRIAGEFSLPLSQRALVQTSNLTSNATTFMHVVPGTNSSAILGAVVGAWANADYNNSTGVSLFALQNLNQIVTTASGNSSAVSLAITFEGFGEAARWTRVGNLGLGNTAPVDRLSVSGNAYISNNIVTIGDATVGQLIVNGSSTFSGNLIPTANITYDLGNSTNRWNDIWLANSTIHLGNAQISANATGLSLATPVGGTLSVSGASADIQTSGNITTTGGIFIGNGSGLTGVVATGNVGAASQLTNGTTSFNIPAAGGNVVGNIGGFVNLYEFSTTGFSAAGNIAGNNISANTVTTSGNITSAGTFIGDGSGLVNVIANVGSAIKILSGTTEINIPVANGNIVANVAGSTNLFQWSTVGFSAQGNITGGNITTAGTVSATGNIQGGNIRTSGVVSATGNITGNFILGNGSQLSGIITSVANINNGSSIMAVVSSGGNIRANIGGTSNVQVIAATGTFVNGVHSVSGNVTGGNLLTGGLISATGNITGGNVTTGEISATGNITASNLNISGNLIDTGPLEIVTGSNGNLTLNAGTGFIVAASGIQNGQANGVGNIGSTGTRFNTVFALASSAQYADLAEYYLADQPYAAGTVLAFGGSRELMLCDRDHDQAVAGIVSDKPAFEMNAGITGDYPVALALAGRVPCQVVGPVRRGQMLVSAGSGRARAEAQPLMGAVIGKALEDFDGTTGTIEVVVGRI